ncbi:MAG TPA: HNH endonuclease signature motif containing protein [Vicinamibacteria bacterium]|nr:HNH endonuclease signature motif containing protein [Vicinamibacteria bacterium]
MDPALRRLVRDRAGHRCEYCRIHQGQDPFFTFPVDHIIARQHGGTTDAGNLCLSCYRCNSHKGPNIASLDPETGELVRLFHPRRDDWFEHFLWQGAHLVGRTGIGRATVKLLAVNHPDYVHLRESLMVEGTFPPS